MNKISTRDLLKSDRIQALLASPQFPPEARTVVANILRSAFPICVVLGKDELQFYNDAYIPIFAEKHPKAFGEPAADHWKEIYPFLHDSLWKVLQEGRTVWDHAAHFPLMRGGKICEAYFDFSYSPLTTQAGDIYGMISIAREVTEEVIHRRRSHWRRLGIEQLGKSTNPHFLWEVLKQQLDLSKLDFSLAAIFEIDSLTGAPTQPLLMHNLGYYEFSELRQALAATGKVPHVAREVKIEAANVRKGSAQSGVWGRIGQGTNGFPPIGFFGAPDPSVSVDEAYLQFASGVIEKSATLLEHVRQLQEKDRQSEQDQRAQDDLYRFLFENVAEAVIYAAINKEEGTETILAANEEASRLLGMPLQQLIGRSGPPVIEPSLLPPDEGANSSDVEIKTVWVGAVMKRVEASARTIRMSDGSVRTLTTLRDVEERLRVQEVEGRRTRLETIAKITGGVAHDFNNLLTVIGGNIELIQDELPGGLEELSAAAQTAALATEKAASLTTQLLTYSRNRPMDTAVADVEQVLREAEDLLAASVPDSIRFKAVHRANGAKCCVDASQLTAAILNLISNSVDALVNRGSITLTTVQRTLKSVKSALDGHKLPSGDYVEVRVSDTGPGVPGAICDRIFDPFFTTKDVGGGTGLGLSTVQGFARQSGGDVIYTPSKAGGSEFCILLPMVQEETGEQANPLLHDAVEEVGGQGLHLLLVEDNHLVRQQTSAALERLGFSVTVCGSGRSAKRILREGEKIDVLVTDIVLPGGISGWKVAASAREQWPALPVLFISGYDPEGHWVEREENSFLLRKPFSRRCLSHALNALLKNERPVEERN